MHAVSDFETFLVTACDIHGVARGRFVFRESFPSACVTGVGIAQAALFCGMLCDIPTSMTDYSKGGWTNGSIVPALTTLKPMSWLSYGDQKVGHVLCDLLDQSREPEVSSSREIAIQQVQALADLGYHIHTSLDLSFSVFPKGSLVPVALHSRDIRVYEAMRKLIDCLVPLLWEDDISKLVQTLTKSLSESNLPVVSIGRGLEHGQLLISLGELQGIEVVDSLHYIHCALKSICAKEGYDFTRMTRPIHGIDGNESNYTMRLTTEDTRNAFGETSTADKMTPVARHWIAGIVRHGPAVTALARPTLNCYSVSDNSTGLLNSWTIDTMDRAHRLHVQTSSCGLTVTDRLPSSASNPYIVFGALIAAGLDGVQTTLDLDDQAKAILKTPPTFPHALASLEEDKVFANLIGEKFVHRFALLKKEYELGRLEKWLAENNGQDILEFQRSLYLTAL